MIIKQTNGEHYNVKKGDRLVTKVPLSLDRWVPIGPSSWTNETSKIPAGTVLVYVDQSNFGSDPGPGFPVLQTEDGSIKGELVEYSNWDVFPSEVIDKEVVKK